MKSGPSCVGHFNSAHRPETGDIARHLSSIAETSVLGAENGLHRGQQSAVHELNAHVASDAHSAAAFAAVSAWQAATSNTATIAAAKMRVTRSMLLDSSANLARPSSAAQAIPR